MMHLPKWVPVDSDRDRSPSPTLAPKTGSEAGRVKTTPRSEALRTPPATSFPAADTDRTRGRWAIAGADPLSLRPKTRTSAKWASQLDVSAGES